jgi:hypothetical protein
MQWIEKPRETGIEMVCNDFPNCNGQCLVIGCNFG